MHLWLLSGNTTASQVAEQVVIDHLLRVLPRRLRCPVSMWNPTSLAELIEAIELAEASFAWDAGEREQWPSPTLMSESLQNRSLEGLELGKGGRKGVMCCTGFRFSISPE